MGFYPAPLTVPDGSETEEFVLEPLTTDHVDLDLDALMDSREMLRVWSGTTWPTDDFSREENWADLDRHASDHRGRDAFTFTVLDPGRTECVGCVYIEPLMMFADPEPGSTVSGDDAVVRFWVRAPRIRDDLDRRLLAALRTWLVGSWEFPKLYVSARPEDRRQCQVLEDAGLVEETTVTVPGRGLLRLFRMT